MPDRALEFNADLRRFANRLDAEVDKVVRKVALDIFAGVVRRTPVATGALRASWQIGVNQVSSDRVNVTGNLTPAAASTIANKEVDKIGNAGAGDVINITNNQPYAIVVEYGLFKGQGPKITSEGYSKQAPAGMLRITIAEVERGIRNALNFTG